jgi:NTP pyrophosphatase (non-canonical NTP hydrolase)
MGSNRTSRMDQDEMTVSKTLADMQARVHEINVTNGWFDGPPRAFGDDIALLHSEVSEAYEAYRQWKLRDTTNELCRSIEHEPGEPLEQTHLCKPEGVGSELADVLVRLLDTCERTGIDIQYEFDRKVDYNLTRGYRHGNKVV